MSSFSGQVSQSSDDAFESSGTVSTTATSMGYTSGNASNYINGNRFQNVTVPNGATVSACHLSVDFSADTGSGACNVDCEDTATPATYSTSSHNISTRTLTGHTANWTMPASTGFQNSADFSTAAQTVFALAGWASGNNLGVCCETTTGVSGNTGLTYDNSPSTAAEISITYASGSAGIYSEPGVTSGAVQTSGLIGLTPAFIVGQATIGSRNFW
jgi:hypothetical protein